MQEIMIAIVLGIAVGCSDLLNYNVKKWLSRFSTVSLFIMLLCLGAKRQQEFAHARIKCEPMHALTGRVNQHGRSAVQEIAGGYLFGTGLEDFIKLHFTGTAGLTAQDGENGPDVDVHINVGGAIQRVKDQHVVPAGECRRNAHQFRILFGSYGAQHTGTLHPVQKNPVGKIVKLLDILTLNVDIPGAAKNIKQTSLIYAAAYDFGRKNKIMKQRSKAVTA